MLPVGLELMTVAGLRAQPARCPSNEHFLSMCVSATSFSTLDNPVGVTPYYSQFRAGWRQNRRLDWNPGRLHSEVVPSMPLLQPAFCFLEIRLPVGVEVRKKAHGMPLLPRPPASAEPWFRSCEDPLKPCLQRMRRSMDESVKWSIFLSFWKSFQPLRQMPTKWECG